MYPAFIFVLVFSFGGKGSWRERYLMKIKGDISCMCVFTAQSMNELRGYPGLGLRALTKKGIHSSLDSNYLHHPN